MKWKFSKFCLEYTAVDPTYEEAPLDLFSDTVELGRILVLKKGEKVPCRTKYKSKKGGDCFIRFR